MKPQHGKIDELTSQDVIQLLQSKSFGHLACHVKDEIYLVPITYVFEDGSIYSHSLPGKKLR